MVWMCGTSWLGETGPSSIWSHLFCVMVADAGCLDLFPITESHVRNSRSQQSYRTAHCRIHGTNRKPNLHHPTNAKHIHIWLGTWIAVTLSTLRKVRNFMSSWESIIKKLIDPPYTFDWPVQFRVINIKLISMIGHHWQRGCFSCVLSITMPESESEPDI